MQAKASTSAHQAVGAPGVAPRFLTRSGVDPLRLAGQSTTCVGAKGLCGARRDLGHGQAWLEVQWHGRATARLHAAPVACLVYFGSIDVESFNRQLTLAYE